MAQQTKPSLKNWNRKTPAKWRNIGDAILILGGGLSLLFGGLPLPAGFKLWALPIAGFLTPLGKFFTKLFGEDENDPVE